MASSIDVCLYLGWDAEKGHEELHEYITAELPAEVAPSQDGVSASGQRLTQVSGCTISEDLPGSGQAGNLRIYAAILRRGRSESLVDHLAKAPWKSHRGLLVVKPEDYEESIIEFGGAKLRVIQDGRFIL